MVTEATNPVTVQIPRETHGSVFCNSHAAFWQKVTLGMPDGSTHVFQGAGEDKVMTGPNGETSFPVSGDRSHPSPVSCTFEFSRNGQNGTFYKARVADPVITPGNEMTQILVVSEDDSDDDFNDSYLTFTVTPGP
jgi:hypothetical protein